jgi:FAD-dependent urate hydroxylase
MPAYDVIIIGAGPYGLSAAAHFNAIPGLRFRIFGEPMGFWKKNMPAGMFLRSSWEASQIADPGNRLTLEAYIKERGNSIPNPIPLRSFVDYGQWFQQSVAPSLDTRKIKNVETSSDEFLVTSEDGEVFQTKTVVVAAGIGPFARRPAEFSTLPTSLASHSSQHTGFNQFNGKRVLVVGGGQSALESGALLDEAGAEVEILVRQPSVHWLRWRGRITRAGILGRLIYSARDVGPPGISQLVARPDYLKLLPRNCQDWIGKRSVRPAGAGWLMGRLKAIPIRTGAQIIAVTQVNGNLRVSLRDGKEKAVDHILLATGYKIDVAKYSFLSPELRSSLLVINGYPRLRKGLESSVRGLFFLGAPASWTFGPVARFVSGAFYCVPAMVRSVVGRQQNGNG